MRLIDDCRQLTSLHGCARQVLLLIVGCALCDILVDDQRPLSLVRNYVHAVRAYCEFNPGHLHWRFGEQKHGDVARGPHLAILQGPQFSRVGIAVTDRE